LIALNQARFKGLNLIDRKLFVTDPSNIHLQRTKHSILIAGASGVVGQAVTEHFASLPDWSVYALSRRATHLPAGVKHVPVDLMDPLACQSAAKNLNDITHLFFGALFELPDLVPGWQDPLQMKTNETMLRNLLDALTPAAKGLRHITLMQGTKAYGGHVEPARVPAKERWPRHNHANFYWLQEDMLRQRQPKSAWNFTVLRPQLVFGYAVSSPMNVVGAIGAYAALMRHRGEPLHFPGGGKYINAASDSRMIAQAAEFAATHEIAANETYNVVNGDMLVWHDIWESVANHFAMQQGSPAPMHLSSVMPNLEQEWASLVSKHQLKALKLSELIGSSWQFTDRALAYGLQHPANSVLSGVKLRQHGFEKCYDTEDSLLYWISRMQSEKLLPI
jgi:nucleoside-diphosphate-sugar epimerase